MTKIVLYISGGNLQGASATKGCDVELMVIDADNLHADGLDSDEIEAISDRECEGLVPFMWDVPDIGEVWELTLPRPDADYSVRVRVKQTDLDEFKALAKKYGFGWGDPSDPDVDFVFHEERSELEDLLKESVT